MIEDSVLQDIEKRIDTLERNQKRIDILERNQEDMNKEIATLKGNNICSSPSQILATPLKQPRYVSGLNEEGYVQLGVSTPPVLISKDDYEECFYVCKTGKDLVLKLLDKVFTKEEMAISNFRGGAVYSNGKMLEKARLDNVRMNALLSQVNLEYPGFMEHPDDEKVIRYAINSKCRHSKTKSP